MCGYEAASDEQKLRARSHIKNLKHEEKKKKKFHDKRNVIAKNCKQHKRCQVELRRRNCKNVEQSFRWKMYKHLLSYTADFPHLTRDFSFNLK